MTSHSPFLFCRHRTEWDDFQYTCTECRETGRSVKAINHTDGCSAIEPDNVPYPVHDTTKQMIRTFISQAVDDLLHNPDVEYVDDIERKTRDKQGVRWVSSESTSRFAVGLGKTNHRGKFHTQSQRSLVLKLDPTIRTDDQNSPVSGNIDELGCWEIACETGTNAFFGEIITCAKDGAWVLMEECIPIDPSHQEEMAHRDMIWDPEREYIDPLRGALRAHGWVDPDWKHGNIGLTATGKAVLIDYGTGPRLNPEAIAPDHVFESIHEEINGEYTTQNIQTILNQMDVTVDP